MLVVGSVISGDFSGTFDGPAEIYDPASQVWTRTASPAHARSHHVATLLDDGTVLVVGGAAAEAAPTPDPASAPSTDQHPVVGAERYDPAAGTWAATAEMVQRRLLPSATKLTDGRVLVVGGAVIDDGHFVFADTAEIFDPRTNAWSPTAPTGQRRGEHTATRLPDGRVLVAGGRQSDGRPDAVLDDAAIYDPASDYWTPVSGLMSVARVAHTAALLPDGTVMVMGGSPVIAHGGGNGEPASSTEIYNSRTDGWSPGPPMNEARMAHSATTLSGDRILVAGGLAKLGPLNLDSRPEAVASAEIYDVRTRTWTSLPPPTAPLNSEAFNGMRHWTMGGYHAAVRLDRAPCRPACDEVMVIGGNTPEAKFFTVPAVASVETSDKGGFPVVVVGLGVLAAAAAALIAARRRAR